MKHATTVYILCSTYSASVNVFSLFSNRFIMHYPLFLLTIFLIALPWLQGKQINGFDSLVDPYNEWFRFVNYSHSNCVLNPSQRQSTDRNTLVNLLSSMKTAANFIGDGYDIKHL
jgi:hypothetical protein